MGVVVVVVVVVDWGNRIGEGGDIAVVILW